MKATEATSRGVVNDASNASPRL